MNCPYQKPSYLTEEEKKNCYATNRGWVILKPHGKYDVVESIADLDVKIAAWHDDNKVDQEVQSIPEELQSAYAKSKKTASVEIQEKLIDVQSRIDIIEKMIEECEESKEVVKEAESKPAKKTAKKTAKKAEKGEKDAE